MGTTSSQGFGMILENNAIAGDKLRPLSLNYRAPTKQCISLYICSMYIGRSQYLGHCFSLKTAFQHYCSLTSCSFLTMVGVAFCLCIDSLLLAR